MKSIGELNYFASNNATSCKEKRECIEKAIEDERYPFLHTFITGIRFNVPECCRLFFLKGMLFFEQNDEYEPFLRQSEFKKGYIMCPECVIKHLTLLSRKKIEVIIR